LKARATIIGPEGPRSYQRCQRARAGGPAERLSSAVRWNLYGI